MARLNREATKRAIIEKAQFSSAMHIDVKGFNKKFKLVRDIKEACQFVRIEPIYHDKK